MRHIIRPGEGTPADPTIVCTVTADDLPGRGIGIIEGTLEPGHLIPPHTHTGVDELIYVLAGEVTAEIGGEVVVAPAGSYVLKPRGVPHAFWNSGATTARVMEMHLPGGFEGYYARMAEVMSPGDPDDPDAPTDDAERFARLTALNHEYDVEHHPELIGPLRERHGLRPVPDIPDR